MENIFKFIVDICVFILIVNPLFNYFGLPIINTIMDFTIPILFFNL